MRALPLPEGTPADVDTWIAALGERRGLAVLDGWTTGGGRWSVVAFEPLAAEVSGLAAAGDELDPAAVRRALGRLPPTAPEPLPGPFAGGWIGALAYDLGVAGERQVLPRDPWASPRVVGGLYTDFLVLDHAERRGWLVLDAEPSDGRAPLAERREAVLDALAAEPPPPVLEPGRGPLVRHVPGSLHRRRVEAARERIARGDFYQANLAHRTTRRVAASPANLYRVLRRANPGPWMGYLAWGGGGIAPPDGAILSASPELLLEVDPREAPPRGPRARTRPIKGTIARGRSPEEDAARGAELLASTKDLAELTMIVDLERNDLGRVARIGSVRVEGLATLETYASVHHLAADVVAELDEGIDALACLLALFPGGSISGAPKLAAMAAIAELEEEGRGFFTGSLGRLDPRGFAAWNVLIRTLVWRPLPEALADGSTAEVSFHVGGGITWSSDPAAEERETLDKGAALAAALRVPGAP